MLLCFDLLRNGGTNMLFDRRTGDCGSRTEWVGLPELFL